MTNTNCTLVARVSNKHLKFLDKIAQQKDSNRSVVLREYLDTLIAKAEKRAGTAVAAASDEPKRKRGRPRKEVSAEPVKRKRGRPRKFTPDAVTIEATTAEPVKRKRGRPRKTPALDAANGAFKEAVVEEVTEAVA